MAPGASRSNSPESRPFLLKTGGGVSILLATCATLLRGEKFPYKGAPAKSTHAIYLWSMHRIEAWSSSR